MLYLIMEHAPNQSLLDYVRSRKRLSESRAALILLQIVAGLQYCHQREVVHRWAWGLPARRAVLQRAPQAAAGVACARAIAGLVVPRAGANGRPPLYR